LLQLGEYPLDHAKRAPRELRVARRSNGMSAPFDAASAG
jgi:hypothetical protein